MNEPIKAGDKCEVINALGRGKSPNIGLEVTVVSRTGEHSTLGVVWHCSNPDIVQLGDAGNYLRSGWADFPTAWLKKLGDPTTPKSEASTVKRSPVHET
jgi:hypothetical protein